MYIDTYVNASDPNVLNKTLTAVESNVQAQLKNDTDMLHPTLEISGNVNQDFNYIYISSFDRYYFVNSKSFSQQRFYINCVVDPLMSHAAEIGALKIIAHRSTSTFNIYQRDPKMPFTERRKIITEPFPSGFSGQHIILAVSGD